MKNIIIICKQTLPVVYHIFYIVHSQFLLSRWSMLSLFIDDIIVLVHRSHSGPN